MTRRLLRTLLSSLAVLLAGASAFAQSTRVAVLPVVIHSIEESGYLREGITEMLSSRLSQQPGLSALRVDDANTATADLDSARAAGRAAGADWVLFGSFTRFGEGASLDLRCVPVSSDAPVSQRSVFVHAGALAELIPRLDSLVERIGTYVRGGVANANAPVAAAVPPADVLAELQALKARVSALEAQRTAAAAAPAPGPAPSEAGSASN
jgi:outer membrane protein insertion porin family